MKKFFSVLLLFLTVQVCIGQYGGFNDQALLAQGGNSGNALLTSLVHYYKMDSFTNNQIWDEVAALTLFEGVQNDFSSNNVGIINSCIASSGGGGLCILDTNNAPSDVWAAASGSQTYQMWIYLNASQISANTSWFSAANSTDGTIFTLQFSSSTGKFTWNYKDTTGAIIALAYSTAPSTLTWHQLVFGVDAANTQLFMYLDGNSKQTATFTNGPKQPTTTTHFTIFNIFPSQTGDPAGRGDEIAIWHGVVETSIQVSTLWNSSAGKPYSSFTH